MKSFSIKKHLLTFGIFLCTTFFMNAQNTSTPISDDEIISIAHQRGIAEVDIAGFILHYKNENKINYPNTSRNVQPAAPTNILNSGFELGNFTDWQGAVGDNTVSSLGPLQNIATGIFSTVTDEVLNYSGARHTIVTSASGNDPNGNFSIVPPAAGIFVARLGGSTSQCQGEMLDQNFVVGANQSYIKVGFAVVLNDGGHLLGESPYFNYSIMDSLNDTIAWRRDEMANNPAGYIVGLNTTYYHPWQYDSISVLGHIGQTLTIHFQVAGCIYSGHFGYCYVDVFDPTNLNSISEANNNSSISIYPNPSNGIFKLVCKENNSTEKPIVIDLSGRIVTAEISKSNSGWQIDMNENAKGIYFVKLKTENGFATQRLVVE